MNLAATPIRRPLRPPIIGWGALAALLLAVPTAAQQPALTVGIGPNPVGLTQQTVLQIRVEVAAMRMLRVQPTFELDKLEVVAGPFQEQSMQFVNGSISNSTTLRWRLRPTAVGTARIKSIEVEVGDTTLTADDLTLTVLQDPVAEAEPPTRRVDPLEEFFSRGRDPFRARTPAEPELYLRVETNPGDPFVGEPVHYTLYLFTRNDVTSVNAENLPDFAGFWKEEPANDSKPKTAQTVTIDGRKWLRVALLERVLYPLRSGELTIEPATIAFTVDVDSSGFFRDRRSVQRRSPKASIAVRAVPEGGPVGNVPIGRIGLTSSLDPTELEAGQAARLSVVARSSGNLRRLGDPQIEAPSGVEVYPPQGEIDRRFTGSGVEFTRTWSWVVVPRQAGTFALPPVELAYFDPQSESFGLASAESGVLRVAPAVPTPGLQASAVRSTSDLHPVRLSAVAALEPHRGVVRGHWLLLAGVLVAAAIGLADVRSAAGGDVKPGSLRGDRASRRDLVTVLSGVDTADPRRTVAEVEAAMRGYLAARWDLPERVAFDAWADRLAGSGLPEESLKRLSRLTDEMHYLRFAPQLSQTGDLTDELKNAALEWARRLPRR